MFSSFRPLTLPRKENYEQSPCVSMVKELLDLRKNQMSPYCRKKLREHLGTSLPVLDGVQLGAYYPETVFTNEDGIHLVSDLDGIQLGTCLELLTRETWSLGWGSRYQRVVVLGELVDGKTLNNFSNPGSGFFLSSPDGIWSESTGILVARRQ